MPPLTSVPERDRHQIADRRKDDRGIERLRWSLVRAAGPFATERAGELLSLDIAWTREGEDPPALMPCDLSDDMRGGTKAEDGQTPAGPAAFKERYPISPAHSRGAA